MSNKERERKTRHNVSFLSWKNVNCFYIICRRRHAWHKRSLYWWQDLQCWSSPRAPVGMKGTKRGRERKKEWNLNQKIFSLFITTEKFVKKLLLKQPNSVEYFSSSSHDHDGLSLCLSWLWLCIFLLVEASPREICNFFSVQPTTMSEWDEMRFNLTREAAVCWVAATARKGWDYINNNNFNINFLLFLHVYIP